MSGYPTKNKDPELLKIKATDDEIKILNYQAERRDYENILKSFEKDNE